MFGSEDEIFPSPNQVPIEEQIFNKNGIFNIPYEPAEEDDKQRMNTIGE